MKQKSRFSLPVAVVISAIAFIYFSTIFVFIDGWFGLMTSPGIMHAAAYTAMAIMCVYSYAVATRTDPGRVPYKYTPDIEDAENPIQEIKRKGGDLRYCQKCSHYKPPRAHHCRVCKRCVLRMDHHCIWINNCVGHGNYKVFFVFVVYAVMACVYSLVLLVGSLTIDPPKDEEQTGDSLRTIYVISSILIVPVSVALSVLLGWHVYLILQNKTTIEHPTMYDSLFGSKMTLQIFLRLCGSHVNLLDIGPCSIPWSFMYHEGVRAMWLAEKGGQVYKHPYNIGVYENLTTVLGPNILCWIWPMTRHIGSGLNFRTSYDNSVGASESQ